jgi:hypothetical protein
MKPSFEGTVLENFSELESERILTMVINTQNRRIRRPEF